jgi:hypothetical protein
MTRSVILFAGILAAAVSASAAETAAETPPRVQAKLHGRWTGAGPCDGELILREDGTFERRHYSPADVAVSGAWSLEWDALPPTLALTASGADDADGTTTQLKLIELNDRVLAYQHAGHAPVRYSRANEDPVGTWKVTRTWSPGSPGEAQDEFTLVIRRDGDPLKGRLEFPQDESSIDSEVREVGIAYQDGTVSFRFGRSHIGDYSGTLTGDAIEGTMAVFLLTGTWEAKRVPDVPGDD